VQNGSFSKVAKELNTSQSTISKRIAALEARLGSQLLIRTSRKLTLTQAGSAFYERCEAILNDLDEAESLASSLQAGPKGVLRVSVPTVFGRLHIAPEVSGFLAEAPDIELDLQLNDRVVDLVGEGIDMAIRISDLTDSAMVARRLGQSPRVLVATRKYIESHGAPHHPNDLITHSCLIYTLLATQNIWHFKTAGEELSIQVAGRFRSNNSEIVLAAALADIGIAAMPLWLAQPYIDNADLVTVLDEFKPVSIPIFALYPQQRFIPYKVRAFTEYLRTAFLNNPLIES
jgi:DNA-binding transcriptional LysR family regulator